MKEKLTKNKGRWILCQSNRWFAMTMIIYHALDVLVTSLSVQCNSINIMRKIQKCWYILVHEYEWCLLLCFLSDPVSVGLVLTFHWTFYWGRGPGTISLILSTQSSSWDLNGRTSLTPGYGSSQQQIVSVWKISVKDK